MSTITEAATELLRESQLDFRVVEWRAFLDSPQVSCDLEILSDSSYSAFAKDEAQKRLKPLFDSADEFFQNKIAPLFFGEDRRFA